VIFLGCEGPAERGAQEETERQRRAKRMERKSPLPRETISQPPRKDTILVNQKTAHVSSDGPLYWLLHQYGINFPKCSADLSLSR